MSTQVLKFVAMVVENLPMKDERGLTKEDIQYFIEHPKEISMRLKKAFVRNMDDLFAESPYSGGFKLIKIHPYWDFRILQANSYPHVAVAVSNYNGSCGHGHGFVFKGPKSWELFRAPCLCCDWYLPSDGQARDEHPKSLDLLKKVCRDNGINALMVAHGEDLNNDKKISAVSVYGSPHGCSSPLFFDFPWLGQTGFSILERSGLLDAQRFFQAFESFVRWGVEKEEDVGELKVETLSDEFARCKENTEE